MRKSAILLELLMLLFSAQILSSQKPYTLQQCKEMALKNNIMMKNSSIELEIAGKVKKSAYTNYFPSIKADAFAFKSAENLLEYTMKGGNLPVYDGNPANLLHPTQFAYFPDNNISILNYLIMGGVNLTQPVFAGGRIANGNKLADLGIDAAKEKLNMEKTEIIVKNEEQYWLIYSLYEKLKTLESFSAMLESLRKDAESAFNAGLITKNDVLKVSIRQNDLNINRLKLQNGIELAIMNYCQFLGTEYCKDFRLADTLTKESGPETYFVDHEQALKSRSENKLLGFSVRAEELQTKMKLGNYLPEFGVGASAVYLNALDKGKFNAMVFGKLSIPISGWWDASYSLQERQLRENIAVNNAKDNSDLMLLQMQKAKNELTECYRQIEFAFLSVQQAEANLKEYRDNFDAGVINISDLLQAQALLQQSREQMAELRSDYRIKTVKYLSVTGR